VPLYGDGLNVRDWLHVDDHCRGVDLLIERGQNGEVYNIGGGNEVRNVDLTHRILSLVGRPTSLITPVADRQGHDRRYALDTSKLRGLGWTPTMEFESGLADTVEWYRANEWWWRPIKEQDPAYRAFHEKQYGSRPTA
jgi:dTDP-glucose 4,6-dehydratase